MTALCATIVIQYSIAHDFGVGSRLHHSQQFVMVLRIQPQGPFIVVTLDIDTKKLALRVPDFDFLFAHRLYIYPGGSAFLGHDRAELRRTAPHRTTIVHAT